MTDETILYISDQAASSNPVLAALKATGYEVVSTNSATQAIALLYLLRGVVGVVLNRRAKEQNRVDVARSLRALRPDVPMVVLCTNPSSGLPSYVDACVDAKQPLAKLTAAIRRLLVGKRFQLLTAPL
jgi:DNA-binding NtrC family response regulator